MGRTSCCGFGTKFTSRRWRSLDPCGLLCVTVSMSIHLYALLTIGSHLVSHSAISLLMYILFYVPVSALALVSLYAAWSTDPGAVPMGARPLTVANRKTPSQLENGKGSAAASLGDGTATAATTGGGSSSSSSSNGADTTKSALMQETEDPLVTTKKKTAASLSSSLMVAGGADSKTPASSSSSLPSLKTTLASPPTTAPSSSSSASRGVRRCHKCNDNYKPPRAHHDSVTGRCVVKFDHYCPWVGNAVGARNHKFFILFIFYTLLSSILSLLLLLIRFVRCSFKITISPDDLDNDDDDDDDVVPPSDDAAVPSEGPEDDADDSDSDSDSDQEDDTAGRTLLKLLHGIFARTEHEAEEHLTDFKYAGCHHIYDPAVVALCIITVLFLIFTCCMLMEQMDAIESNVSKIARMKLQQSGNVVGGGPGATATATATTATTMAHHELQRVTTEVNEMFGGDHPRVALHWFNPFVSVRFVDDVMTDAIMGYQWDPAYGSGPFREDDVPTVTVLSTPPSSAIVSGSSSGAPTAGTARYGGILSTSSSSSLGNGVGDVMAAAAPSPSSMSLAVRNNNNNNGGFVELSQTNSTSSSSSSSSSLSLENGIKKRSTIASAAAASETGTTRASSAADGFPVLSSSNRIV